MTSENDNKGMIIKVNWSKKTERFTCKTIEDQCTRNACLCDEQLAYQLSEAEELFDPVTTVEAGFTFDESCRWNMLRTRPEDDVDEKFCCGQYPNKFTYPGKSQTKKPREFISGSYIC